jgi:hypothetical protein
MAANRVTSTGLEVLSSGAPANARVTSTGLEVLSSGAPANVRVTLTALEVLSSLTTFGPQQVNTVIIIQ